jgi:hypothetical protein
MNAHLSQRGTFFFVQTIVFAGLLLGVSSTYAQASPQWTEKKQAAALSFPVSADVEPEQLIKRLYAANHGEEFDWSIFETPAAFSSRFVSTWRQAMKQKDCDLYDADLLLGGSQDGKGNELHSTKLKAKTTNRAEVVAYVSPANHSYGASNVHFKLIWERNAWRIDYVMDAGGSSAMTSLNKTIQTKCRAQ